MMDVHVGFGLHDMKSTCTGEYSEYKALIPNPYGGLIQCIAQYLSTTSELVVDFMEIELALWPIVIIDYL